MRAKINREQKKDDSMPKEKCSGNFSRKSFTKQGDSKWPKDRPMKYEKIFELHNIDLRTVFLSNLIWNLSPQSF